ncbi:MAG TPA: two-component regulator propeller domain-containing protein, partial [Kofleriaceae bacterium]
AQLLVFDRDGRWWYPTSDGIARYPRVDRLEDLATQLPELFGVREGLTGRDVFRVFADSRGDIWIATLSAMGLTRWDHSTQTFAALGPEWPHAVAVAFTEDRAGTLWIGFSDSTLVRVRDGRPRTFRGGELPSGAFAALLVDARGNLWIASDRDGVARVEDPNADVLHVRRYPLAATQALTLVDDAAGNIYVGTNRGIDRIDPVSGSAAHFGIREGLPSEYVHCSLRDRDGTLWFGTKRGAVHMTPPPAEQLAAKAPPVYFEKIAVTNEPVPLIAGGERTPPSLVLEPNQHQLDIEFDAPSFAVGTAVRFQYRLDDGAWSAPTGDRFVHFAKLGAGSYHFEVRSVLANGAASTPAALSFMIKPPVWRRWWFLTLAGLILGAAGYALYRWRLAHALAVERVRTRIASDLHDELGANLSRIAILSEVASRRAGARDELVGPIGDIGRSARELVDVAADIVWSTDPRRDDLHSLIVRLRHFAGDVLEARGIAWSLEGPDDPARIKLTPDCRRHLYLIVKEAVHNVARHSSARNAWVTIRCHDRALHANIRDDGRGFDEATLARRGNGLDNMRTRAREAGGTLTITSLPDGGTEIRCELPA